MTTTYDMLKEEHPEILKEFFEDFRFADEDSMAETVNDVYRGAWNSVEDFAMEELEDCYCDIDLDEFPHNCISPRRVWDYIRHDYFTYKDDNERKHIFLTVF